MRMRGVEKNISSRGAKFTICQPEVCAVPGVVVAVEGREGMEGRRGEAVGVRYVSLSIQAFQRALFSFFLLQLLLARITNHSLQRLLVTSSFPLNNIWRC